MRGRVAAVLLLLSLVSLDSSGQCGFTPQYSGQFRSTVYDLALDGNYLWAADGYGIQLLQITASGPEVVDVMALPGPTRNVAAAPGLNLAYAGSGARVFVLRRVGNRIELVRSVDAPDVINDIAAGGALFVATRNGIAHYHLFDPSGPVRTTSTLTTSRVNVTGLEIDRTTLYAADGDSSVEVFNISTPSLPQRTGQIEALPRASSVHAGTDNLLYVSDDFGQNTDVFAGTSRLARVPYGSTAFASTSSSAVFMAGSDRTLRAIDLTNPSRAAELFEQQFAPTGGTSNAVYDLLRSGTRLFVAAGDIGLVTYDISPLTSPYPLLAYTEGATTSALIIGGSTPKAYFTNPAGSIIETSTQLAVLRTAAGSGAPLLHDSRGADLLISNDKSVSLTAMTPPATFEATFRATVTQAVMIGTDTIVALLADQSVWTVKTTAGSTPTRVDTGGALISSLARNATTYALGEVRDDQTTVSTVIHIPSASKKYTIGGAATGGIAINATHAAFFTFQGINLVDLSTGAVTTLPGSDRLLPIQLAFSGSNLLVLGDRTLMVWDTTLRTLSREHPLPANAVRMHVASDKVAVATGEGMLILDYLDQLPLAVTEPGLNRYYTKAVSGRDRLYLFGSDGLDVYETALGVVPRSVASVVEPGLVDLAATPETLFTLSGDRTVSSYSRNGVRIAKTLVDEGADTQALSIATAGDAVWVTISKGCLSGTCQKRTLILDPRTLAVSSSLEGGVVDVTTAGSKAYALVDLPSEVAVFDMANPLQPVKTAQIGAPESAQSIAFANNRVLVLGDKLYKYTPALAAAGEELAPSAADDQQIRIAGNCAVVVGRIDSPALYDAGTFASSSLIETPSPARSVAAMSDGRLYVLTDHSVEVWTLQPLPPQGRRRSVR